jgi:hypothetical protein
MRYHPFIAHIVLASLVVVMAGPALPCSGVSLTAADVGPADWDGRDDVPANWIYQARPIGVDSESGSWWARRLPDSRFERLFVESGSEFFVVSPVTVPVSGEYEVVSFLEQAPDFDAFETGGVGAVRYGRFMVIDVDEASPPAPEVMRSELQGVFDQSDNSCGSKFNDTWVRFFVAPDEEIALFTLRRLDEGNLVDWSRLFPGDSEVFLSEITPDPGLLDYRIEAFDRAGNSASIDVVMNAGCAGACSNSGPIEPCGLLALLALLRFRRRRCGGEIGRAVRHDCG